MAADFSKVKVGDRVRLAQANGDEATVTVTWVTPHRVQSATNIFYSDEWHTVEVLPRPLPTERGLYLGRRGACDRRNLFEFSGHAWYRLYYSAGIIMGDKEMQAQANELTFLADPRELS